MNKQCILYEKYDLPQNNLIRLVIKRVEKNEGRGEREAVQHHRRKCWSQSSATRKNLNNSYEDHDDSSTEGNNTG